MAADTSESTAEKLTFTCASCGFECNYEYFGKKPPFSKSVVYVYYFFVRGFLFFCCRTLFPRVTTQFARSLTRQSIRSFKNPSGKPQELSSWFSWLSACWMTISRHIKATDRKWHSFPLITITFFTSVLWQTSGRCICYSRSFLTKCGAFNIRWTVLLVYKTHLHFTGICAYFNDIVWLYIISPFFFLPIFSLCRLSCHKSLFPYPLRRGGKGGGLHPLSLPWVTRTEFLLTTSVQNQAQ